MNWDGRARRAQAARRCGEIVRRAPRRRSATCSGRLGLSHFALIPSGGGRVARRAGTSADTSGDPGFDVRLVGRELIVTSVDRAAASLVRPGWRITRIGSAHASRICCACLAARAGPAGSNDRLLNVEAWRIAQTRLRGPAGSKIDVTFENGQGALVRSSLERRPEQGESGHGREPADDVRAGREGKSIDAVGRQPRESSSSTCGWPRWTRSFSRRSMNCAHADGIIIDLRGNPGGLAGDDDGDLRTLRRRTQVARRDEDARQRVPVLRQPAARQRRGERVEPFAGPVAILIDAMSGSASECFTGGMQSIGRARVFGQTSMGQALPALFDRMPNGDVLIHAYGDFVTADGHAARGARRDSRRGRPAHARGSPCGPRPDARRGAGLDRRKVRRRAKNAANVT